MQTPELKSPSFSVQDIACDNLPGSWREWVETQAKDQERAWLLVFALEGAAWGVIENGNLRMADTALDRKILELDKYILQELFVFSPKGQTHAWVEGGTWKAYYLTESGTSSEEMFDQELILWGTRSPEDGWKDGFAVLIEGAQGMTQAVPLLKKPKLTTERQDAPRLKVRNYLGQNPQNGAAYVAATRFIELIG